MWPKSTILPLTHSFWLLLLGDLILSFHDQCVIPNYRINGKVQIECAFCTEGCCTCCFLRPWSCFVAGDNLYWCSRAHCSFSIELLFWKSVNHDFAWTISIVLWISIHSLWSIKTLMKFSVATLSFLKRCFCNQWVPRAV